MEIQFAIEIFRNALITAALVAAPMLIAGLVVGVSLSLVQAVTQVHEMTLTFIPKIMAVLLTLVICLPWMLSTIVRFAEATFEKVLLIKNL